MKSAASCPKNQLQETHDSDIQEQVNAHPTSIPITLATLVKHEIKPKILGGYYVVDR